MQTHVFFGSMKYGSINELYECEIHCVILPSTHRITGELLIQNTVVIKLSIQKMNPVVLHSFTASGDQAGSIESKARQSINVNKTNTDVINVMVVHSKMPLNIAGVIFRCCINTFDGPKAFRKAYKG